MFVSFIVCFHSASFSNPAVILQNYKKIYILIVFREQKIAKNYSLHYLFPKQFKFKFFDGNDSGEHSEIKLCVKYIVREFIF